MTRFLTFPIAVAFIAATLGACSTADDPLAGRTFSLEDTDIEALEGAPLRVAFSEGRIDVSGGCNLIGGEYRIKGSTIVLGTMMQTEMACEQSRMDQDAAIIEFLQTGPTFDIENSTLTLTDGEGVTVWATTSS